jgi:hypothetical protein
MQLLLVIVVPKPIVEAVHMRPTLDSWLTYPQPAAPGHSPHLAAALLHRNRQHPARCSGVVERNAHLINLPGVTQLVLFAHTEASIVVEAHSTSLADEGATLDFSCSSMRKSLPLGCNLGCKH